MSDIAELLDRAETLQAELQSVQNEIMELVRAQALESARLALTSAVKALRKAEHYPSRAEQREELRASRHLCELQLGWQAA